jgi:peptidoglycan/LPS O-acetylase OafA/YrhL
MANPSPISSPRYRSLDSYRFIAASLVVLHHYHADFAMRLGALTPIVTRLEVMVDFFFALSGFVIAVTYARSMTGIGDYLIFLKRRVARLYPLHLAILSVFVGLALVNKFGLLTANHVQELDFDTLPANLLMLHAWGTTGHLSFNASSWSISAEWLAYLLFPLFLVASRRLPLAANLAAAIGAVALLTLWRHAAGIREWYEATFDYGALRALPSFFVGVVIAGVVETSLPNMRAPWLAVHLTFLAALASLYFDLRDLAIALLALVVLLAALAERNGRPSFVVSRLMGKLGDTSYSIYMIHVLASIPVLFVLRKVGLLGTPLASGVALMTYIAVVPAAWFIYTHFETPLRRWVSALGTRATDRDSTAPALAAQTAHPLSPH